MGLAKAHGITEPDFILRQRITRDLVHNGSFRGYWKHGYPISGSIEERYRMGWADLLDGWEFLFDRCEDVFWSISDLREQSDIAKKDTYRLGEYLKEVFKPYHCIDFQYKSVARLLGHLLREWHEVRDFYDQVPDFLILCRYFVLIKHMSFQVRKGNYKPKKRGEGRIMEIKIKTDQDLRDASAYVLEGLLNGTVPYRIANSFATVQRNVIMMNAQRIRAQIHNGVQTVKIPALCSERLMEKPLKVIGE